MADSYFSMVPIRYRETRERCPLLTIETEANGAFEVPSVLYI
jgi:hypothetical protein